MKVIIQSLVILLFIFTKNVDSYGESDSSGLPSYQEREQFNLVNLIRMFPTQWKTDYMGSYSNQKGMLVNYPAVAPLYYDNTLNKLALSHSQDMGNNNCFQHNSCDGTNIWTRFGKYITCKGPNGAMSENIAAGADALEAIKMLVCDETNGQCANDKSSGDGHRSSIMSGDYKTLGVGYYSKSGSDYTQYWTQDFNDGNCNSPTNPIYSGYHTWVTSNPQFIVLFYSTTDSVSTMSLVFGDGNSKVLSRTYGTAGAGAYITTSTYVACQSYYYEVKTTGSKTYRYPETGFLQVSKSSSCSGWVISASVTPTSTPTETATPTPTETATPTPTETVTPSPTETVTPSPTETVTPSPTETVTPSPTETVTPSPTETVTPSPTETVTPSPTETVTPSPTETVTPSPTETVTPSPTETVTPSPTETVTPSPTETVTPSPTETVTPTPTETVTPTPTETVTPTPTETVTPLPTDSATPSTSDSSIETSSETKSPITSSETFEAPSDSSTLTTSESGGSSSFDGTSHSAEEQNMSEGNSQLSSDSPAPGSSSSTETSQSNENSIDSSEGIPVISISSTESGGDIETPIETKNPSGSSSVEAKSEESTSTTESPTQLPVENLGSESKDEHEDSGSSAPIISVSSLSFTLFVLLLSLI
ncbi:hypothetical protein ACTA71_012508 [Dictyostelium dimigraforme]